MAELSHGERLDRLERVVQILAEDQVSLQKIVTELAIETRRGFDLFTEQNTETQRRLQEVAQRLDDTDRLFRETDERFRRTDSRVENLVSALGEFIRRLPPPTNSF